MGARRALFRRPVTPSTVRKRQMTVFPESQIHAFLQQNEALKGSNDGVTWDCQWGCSYENSNDGLPWSWPPGQCISIYINL